MRAADLIKLIENYPKDKPFRFYCPRYSAHYYIKFTDIVNSGEVHLTRKEPELTMTNVEFRAELIGILNLVDPNKNISLIHRKKEFRLK